MKIYTSQQMRQREQAAVDKGATFEGLMENAGQAAAADLLRRLPEAGRALVVCGKGNNGGDGLVIARVLQAAGWCADIVFVAGSGLSELAELNRRRLQGLANIEFIAADELEGRLKSGLCRCAARKHCRRLPPAEPFRRPQGRPRHPHRLKLR